MSDEELERLAAEMKNIKPTETARKRGMDAAMAAFDAEFAAESEKNVNPAQGYEAELRPTDQKINGSTMVSKFKNIFALPPKSAMLLGSCLAAMTFAFVIVPPAMEDQVNSGFETVASEVDGAPAAVAESRNDQRSAEKVIPGVTRMKKERTVNAPKPAAQENAARLSDSRPVPSISKENTTRTVPQPPPSTERQQSSVNEVFQQIRSGSANVQRENTAREKKFRAERDQRPSLHSETDDGYYLRGEPGNGVHTDIVGAEVRSRDKFEAFEPNPITSVKETPVSTFSVDVDTASYSFLRASINRGQIPHPSTIRLEEMINYFPYDYDAPTSKSEPFKANVTVTPSPWNADTKLMHIGIKGYVPPAAEKPRSNIVLLIDTSGSMRAQNKLPLLIESFKLLLGTLDEEDTVSIVTYAGSAGTVLEPTPASETGTIKRALNNLRSGGSTAGAAGLELAYNKAQESFDKDGVNRVILATDGDFNVGFSSPDEMKRFIEKKRKSGIFLSVMGFGMGNYNDQLMQTLAQNGNGVAAYIDSLAEAQKVLADEAGSALIPIAKDVKIQVEFNPATIAEYRLIGYETRALKREDFNNDAVDAGDINSGHTVTAIYEMTPVGSKAVTVDDLRYAADEVAENDSDEFAFIKIRHKLPNADKSTLQTFPIGQSHERSLRQVNQDTRFAAAVGAFGQKLRGDSHLSDYSYANIAELARGGKGDDRNGYRAEFIQLVNLVNGLERD